MARMSPEINAGSMADIAFLLLIFFLVTTTMDVDTGLRRLLPPPVNPNQPPPPPVRERNVIPVLVDMNDRLLVRGELSTIRDLRERTRNYLLNPTNDPTMPERYIKNVENLGEVETSRGVISLQNDRGTSYEMYVAVQNELAAAINDIRDELTRERFGMRFNQLTDPDLVRAIREAVPMAISEAEPKDIGGRR
jgi:biopolymer transport protein ExbD